MFLIINVPRYSTSRYSLSYTFASFQLIYSAYQELINNYRDGVEVVERRGDVFCALKGG